MMEKTGDFKQLDQLDKQIIHVLSTSSQSSFRQLAKQISIHPTTLMQRVKALEARGVIRGYRAKIDYFQLGYDYMGIVQVYSDNVVMAEQELSKFDEVVAVYDITGDADAIAIVACEDRELFYSTIKRIGALPSIRKTNTNIILDVVKAPEDFIPKM